MNFLDTLQPQGHLEIVKIYDNTEEVLFSDHNIIVSGMGQTIAQMMSESDCSTLDATCVIPSPTRIARSGFDNSIGEVTDPVIDIMDREGGLTSPCEIGPYNLRHFQLGKGASGVTEASTLSLLGGPLTKNENGNPDVASVETREYLPWADEDTPASYGPQTFVNVKTYGPNGSGITYILVLDEDTANGQILNEIGLFSHNPFMKALREEGGQDDFGIRGAGSSLLGDATGPSDITKSGDEDQIHEDPGTVLCAYRQYRDIHKESFFALIFRWTIYFSNNR